MTVFFVAIALEESKIKNNLLSFFGVEVAENPTLSFNEFIFGTQIISLDNNLFTHFLQLSKGIKNFNFNASGNYFVSQFYKEYSTSFNVNYTFYNYKFGSGIYNLVNSSSTRLSKLKFGLAYKNFSVSLIGGKKPYFNFYFPLRMSELAEIDLKWTTIEDGNFLFSTKYLISKKTTFYSGCDTKLKEITLGYAYKFKDYNILITGTYRRYLDKLYLASLSKKI